MHKSFRGLLTAEDRRVVRNWTRAVVIVYGALALIVLGLASLSHYFTSPTEQKVPRQPQSRQPQPTKINGNVSSRKSLRKCHGREGHSSSTVANPRLAWLAACRLCKHPDTR
jgi:hypothetical protein